VLKDAPGEEIVWATTKVANGESWLDPQVTQTVLEAYRRVTVKPRPNREPIEHLTEREADVLRLVGRGANNAEIAAELHIGEATVKSHLGHVLTKLHLRDRAAAIVFAHEHGLVR
jgi:DNA-binding NarL/FixJ family response regulator